MTLVVVDASVAASWLLPNQATPAAKTLFETWSELQAIAPDFFAIEVRSILLKAERRGWSPGLTIADLLEQLARLEIKLEPPLDSEALNLVLELARLARVRLYDALYLDLAFRTGAWLASRDANLLDGAALVGAAVIDLRSSEGLNEESAAFVPM